MNVFFLTKVTLFVFVNYLVVSTSEIDCMERFVSEIIFCVEWDVKLDLLTRFVIDCLFRQIVYLYAVFGNQFHCVYWTVDRSTLVCICSFSNFISVLSVLRCVLHRFLVALRFDQIM